MDNSRPPSPPLSSYEAAPVTLGEIPKQSLQQLAAMATNSPAEAAVIRAPQIVTSQASTANLRAVPIDWEALEDAFENNAPEIHSYLQIGTGEVIRVVDGVADPQMHARVAADPNYVRIDSVNSREQYRWMERFIPMIQNPELQDRLGRSIDGKGAFRRFKDALMSFADERERWFVFRSERLKTFMDSWLATHNIKAIPKTQWKPSERPVSSSQGPFSSSDSSPQPSSFRDNRRRNPETMRKHLRDVSDVLGPRDLEMLSAFADFLKARRVARMPRSSSSELREDLELTSMSSRRIYDLPNKT